MRRPVRLAEVERLPLRRVAGIMTGTSLDGMDIAILEIERDDPGGGTIIGHASHPMPAGLRERLGRAPALDIIEGARLSRELGLWYADAVAELCESRAIGLDLVGLHGQTVYHEHAVVTVQLGQAGFLAARLGCPVVHDFRQNDIVAGGCGAPLVSAFDWWRLSRPGAGIVALNLGGIANITAMPPREQGPDAIIGFDCGPANMVVDGLVERFTGGTLRYDRDGAFASRGRVREDLVAGWMGHPFLRGAPPKSCGREEFGAVFVESVLAQASPTSEQDWFDLVATATAFSARAIVGAVQEYVCARAGAPERVVAAGGGARNPVLMRGLDEGLGGISLVTTEAYGIPVELKEAAAFASLASARIDHWPGNVPSVTGAGRAVLLGSVVEI